MEDRECLPWDGTPWQVCLAPGLVPLVETLHMHQCIRRKCVSFL